MNLLDPNFLFASLVWSSIGAGYWIYGKRQQSLVAMLGGVLMIVTSCFVPSVLWMSLLCIGLMALVYFLLKQGS